MPKEKNSIIKVIGVGGGGCNAVNYMFNNGIKGVDFVLCNTDAQALELSSVTNKIQLGSDLTEGLGAGANPSVGKECTLSSLDEVRELLANNTKMVFITCGMGGGTGTGGAPVIAQLAKEMGILTVAIVTTPFTFEGRRRSKQAEEGLRELKENVDTLLVINNDKVREIYGNLSFSDAFSKADDILANAARGIAEIITVTGYVNVDFHDVQTVMKDSGLAIMGSATAEGENRALDAIESAINSPLLDDNNIQGANYILLNITTGKKEALMDEITEMMEYVQNVAGQGTDIIWGNCTDSNMDDELNVIVIATGFENKQPHTLGYEEPQKKVMQLEDGPKVEMPTNTFKAPEVAPVEEVKEEVEPTLFEFDLRGSANETPKEEEVKEPTRYTLDMEMEEESEVEVTEVEASSETVDRDNEEIELDVLKKKHDERVNQLRGLSKQLRNPGYLSEIENEPAYKRRQVDLEDTPHSSEQRMSRYTLSDPEDGTEGRPEIRPNNSFLHDNVD